VDVVDMRPVVPARQASGMPATHQPGEEPEAHTAEV
jgi:hypothetical protein